MKSSLEKRLAYLEDRVKQLELQLDDKQEISKDNLQKDEQLSSKAASTTTIVQDPIASSASTTATQKTQPNKQPAKESKPIEWEILIFQKIVPRVFIFIFILGVLWGLKASYDYGIITIQVILTLSILLSITMATLGVFQIKKKRPILGQVLIGGSLPVFMLTIFSMHQIYFMIGPGIAMTLNIAAIIAGVIFTYNFRSESIGIISVVGGILVPYLIDTITPNYYVFVAYEAILYLVFLSLALYLNVRVLYFVATFFLHLAIFGMHLFTSVPEEYILLTLMPIVFQQIALFAGLILTKIKLQIQAHTVLASLLLTSLWVGVLLEVPEATTIFIGLTIIYAISFFLFQTDTVRAPIFLVNATLSLLFIFMVQELDITYETLLITTAIHIFYAIKFKAIIHYVVAAIQYMIAFILFSSYYVDSWFSYPMLHKLTFLLVTIAALYFIQKRTNIKKLYQFSLPFVALLLMFFSTDLAYLIADQGDVYDSMPLILSAFWVLIAIAYMIFGKVSTIQIGKFIGIAILFFTVAKVVLFDISFMSMALRAILFIGLGLVGLAISRVYSKKS